MQRACVLLDIRGDLAGSAAGFLPGRESPVAGRNKPLHAQGGSGPSKLRENAPGASETSAGEVFARAPAAVGPAAEIARARARAERTRKVGAVSEDPRVGSCGARGAAWEDEPRPAWPGSCQTTTLPTPFFNFSTYGRGVFY